MSKSFPSKEEIVRILDNSTPNPYEVQYFVSLRRYSPAQGRTVDGGFHQFDMLDDAISFAKKKRHYWEYCEITKSERGVTRIEVNK